MGSRNRANEEASQTLKGVEFLDKATGTRAQNPVIEGARLSTERRSGSLRQQERLSRYAIAKHPQSSQYAPNQDARLLKSFWIEVARRSPRFLPVPLEEIHSQQQKFYLSELTLGSSVHQLLDYHLSLGDLLHLTVLSDFNQGLKLAPDDRGKAF